MSSAYPYGYVPYSEMMDWVRDHPMPWNNVPLTVCVWGAKGVGKTETIKAYCKENDLGYKRVLLSLFEDASSLVGIKKLNEETGQLEYAPPDWLPLPGSKIVRDHPNGGVLFFDEINRANPEVIQGLFELLDDGKISLIGYELPPGWHIVAAANPKEKGYNVHSMDTAFLNRMINYAPGWSETEWVNYALNSGFFNRKIIDFVLQNPHVVKTGESRLPADIIPEASPRAITYLNCLFEEDMPLRLLHTLAIGLVGEDAVHDIIRVFKDDGLEPLTGKEVLLGVTNDNKRAIDYIDEWWEKKRIDLIRASTVYAIAQLYAFRTKINLNKPPKEINNFYRWCMNLPDYFWGELIAYMEENLPELLAFYKTDVPFSNKIPARSKIQKPDKLQLRKEADDQFKSSEDEKWRADTEKGAEGIDGIDDDILEGL